MAPLIRYYQLFEKLTEEAAANVAYNNAEKLYFANWDVPKGGGTAAGGELRYQHMPSSTPPCMHVLTTAPSPLPN